MARCALRRTDRSSADIMNRGGTPLGSGHHCYTLGPLLQNFSRQRRAGLRASLLYSGALLRVFPGLSGQRRVESSLLIFRRAEASEMCTL